MKLVEWLQSCTIEELAEWLVTFQRQSEDNIFESIRKQGVVITTISVDTDILCAQMIKHLQKELEADNE